MSEHFHASRRPRPTGPRFIKPAGAKGRIAWWLRCLADRIHPESAPRYMSYSFTFEHGEGVRFRDDGWGCGLWYLGHANYERAHTEADSVVPSVEESTDA